MESGVGGGGLQVIFLEQPAAAQRGSLTACMIRTGRAARLGLDEQPWCRRSSRALNDNAMTLELGQNKVAQAFDSGPCSPLIGGRPVEKPRSAKAWGRRTPPVTARLPAFFQERERCLLGAARACHALACRARPTRRIQRYRVRMPCFRRKKDAAQCDSERCGPHPSEDRRVVAEELAHDAKL